MDTAGTTTRDLLARITERLDRVQAQMAGKDASQVQPLGDVNFAMERLGFEADVRALRKIVGRFHHWRSPERGGRAGLRHCLQMIKEDAQMNMKAEEFGTVASTCRRLLREAVAEHTGTAATAGRERYSLAVLSEQLRELSGELGVTYFKDEGRTSDGATSTQIYLAGTTFNLEIAFEESEDPGAGAKVQLSHLGVNNQASQDELVNDHLTDLIRRGNVAVLRSKLQFLVSLERVLVFQKDVDLLSCLRGLEADLLALQQNDVDAGMSWEDCLLRGAGVVQREHEEQGSSSGLSVSIRYFSLQPEDILNTAWKACVRLEESSRYHVLPLQSCVNKGAFDDVPMSRPLLASFAVHLDPPVLMCRHIAAALLRSSRTGGDNYGKHDMPALQHLLAAREAGDSHPSLYEDVLESKVTVLGKEQFYVHVHEMVPGVEVHRVPLHHPCEMHALLGVLRQQIMFNELFASCFCSYQRGGPDLDSSGGDQGGFLLVELSSSPPANIALVVATQGPIPGNVFMELVIGAHGVLAATCRASPPPCFPFSSSHIEQLLRASHSIPLALQYCLSDPGP